MTLHRRRQARNLPSQLCPSHLSNLRPAFAHLGERDFGILLANGAALRAWCAAARDAGVEDVLGEVDVDAGEPLRNGVDACRLIDDGCVGAGVDEAEEVEDLVVELGAVLDGVLIEVPE
ncbi:hypothetical protein B7463_g3803, partial [Scytalidium lignicola]